MSRIGHFFDASSMARRQDLEDHRKLRAECRGRHLWAPGYFVATSGNVTDDAIAEYIRLQGAEPNDDDRFRVSE